MQKMITIDKSYQISIYFVDILIAIHININDAEPKI